MKPFITINIHPIRVAIRRVVNNWQLIAIVAGIITLVHSLRPILRILIFTFIK